MDVFVFPEFKPVHQLVCTIYQDGDAKEHERVGDDAHRVDQDKDARQQDKRGEDVERNPYRPPLARRDEPHHLLQTRNHQDSSQNIHQDVDKKLRHEEQPKPQQDATQPVEGEKHGCQLVVPLPQEIADHRENARKQKASPYHHNHINHSHLRP